MQCMWRRIFIYHSTHTQMYISAAFTYSQYTPHNSVYSTHIQMHTALCIAHVRMHTSSNCTHCMHLIALVSCTVLDIPCSRRTGNIFPRTTIALEAPGPVGSHALMVTLDSSLQAISAASRTLSCTRRCSKHNTASADMFTQSI